MTIGQQGARDKFACHAPAKEEFSPARLAKLPGVGQNVDLTAMEHLTMQSDRVTAAQALIHECEELAQTRFDVSTRVDVGILPALDGDFWKAEIVQTTTIEAAGSGQASSQLRIEAALTSPCHARSKIAALEALKELLIAAPRVKGEQR